MPRSECARNRIHPKAYTCIWRVGAINFVGGPVPHSRPPYSRRLGLRIREIGDGGDSQGLPCARRLVVHDTYLLLSSPYRNERACGRGLPTPRLVLLPIPRCPKRCWLRTRGNKRLHFHALSDIVAAQLTGMSSPPSKWDRRDIANQRTTRDVRAVHWGQHYLHAEMV